jgi:peptidoglycan/LPS O-acetylase OafA/YrhL
MPLSLSSSNLQAAGLTRHRRALPALTGIRFLAAFYVVLFHGLPWLQQKFTLPNALQIFFRNGYIAVSLFFVLSGFILAYTYEGQIEGGTYRLRFWEARFARIYPVYFLSLLLAFWFERGLALSVRIAVLGMVQAWNPLRPEWAGAWNYPAWSLSVEAFFYLCFPFLLPWMARRSRQASLWMTIVLLTICVLIRTPILGLGPMDTSMRFVRIVPLPILRVPEFMLGMGIGLRLLRNESEGKVKGSEVRSYLAASVALIILSLPVGHWVSLVVIPFAILIYDLAAGQSLLARFLSTPLMVMLGSASYAIYLLQFPVRSWTRVVFSHFSDRSSRLGAPLTPLILIIFSVGVFFFWEEPCRIALRTWFANRKVRMGKIPTSSSTEKQITR